MWSSEVLHGAAITSFLLPRPASKVDTLQAQHVSGSLRDFFKEKKNNFILSCDPEYPLPSPKSIPLLSLIFIILKATLFLMYYVPVPVMPFSQKTFKISENVKHIWWCWLISISEQERLVVTLMSCWWWWSSPTMTRSAGSSCSHFLGREGSRR